MRTLKTQSTRAALIRMQTRMDQQYIVNVAKNVMGELGITQDELMRNPGDFSLHVFDSVLCHIQEWNSTTLGKIAAYGLSAGETSGDIPLRTTSLKDVYYGCPLELEVADGASMLEWLAAMTIVAAVYDLLRINDFVRHLHAKATEGGQNGCSVAEAIQSY